jgi:hypothetical protein
MAIHHERDAVGDARAILRESDLIAAHEPKVTIP